jgi:hypothetical protein
MVFGSGERMTIQILSNVPNGTKVILGYQWDDYTHFFSHGDNVEATILSNNDSNKDGMILIGWEQIPKRGNRCWELSDAGWHTQYYQQGYRYAYFVPLHLSVEMLTFIPDQKCIECGISMAHKSFNDNEKIVCLSCKIHNEL